MIRHLGLAGLLVIASMLIARDAQAARFELLTGSVLEGEAVPPINAQGVVIKLTSGGYSPREPWTNFSQSALKQLVKIPSARQFADPLIEEEEPEEPPRSKAVAITLQPVDRLDRPNPRASIFSLFGSPITGLMLFLIYAASVYAGYEIALYRNFSTGLVCGVAAVAPILGPIIFLCMPTKILTLEQTSTALGPTEPIAVPETQPLLADPGGADAAPPPPPAAAGGLPPPTIFRKPQFTFNRRFFETRTAGFLRVVPSEAEQDLVLCVSAVRGNFVAHRISKILPNELLLLVKKGEASTDAIVPYSEITEVQIRHKDSIA